MNPDEFLESHRRHHAAAARRRNAMAVVLWSLVLAAGLGVGVLIWQAAA